MNTSTKSDGHQARNHDCSHEICLSNCTKAQSERFALAEMKRLPLSSILSWHWEGNEMTSMARAKAHRSAYTIALRTKATIANGQIVQLQDLFSSLSHRGQQHQPLAFASRYTVRRP